MGIIKIESITVKYDGLALFRGLNGDFEGIFGGLG